MKLTINTVMLQNMVAKAMKGASCNKMIPLTGMMAIQLKDNRLTLITTDASNYLYVSESVTGDDFYVVVVAEIFSKLVSKLTCDTTTIELRDSSLRIIGNGRYDIDLPLNEDGELVVFPDPYNNYPLEEETYVGDVNLSTVRLILNTAKASLGDTEGVYCYSGYYVRDKVVSTDTLKICSVGINVFEEPALISPDTMTLLDVFTEEKIKVFRDGNIIIFDTPDCILYGVLMDCIDDFQIDAIDNLLVQEFDSSCKVYKNDLMQLLDRLSLFVSTYDKNCIYLTFTRDGLQVDSKQANSTETIKCTESNNFKDFTCCIKIDRLASQVKANTGDVIEIQYGMSNAIRLTEGNITQIVALEADTRM